MKKKAVLYIRVSTLEQVITGVSLDAQEEKLRAYCSLQELEIIRVFKEEGVSASKPLNSRPQGSKMLAMLKSKKVSHVVALKLDRLFRNAEDALHQTGFWDSTGVTLHLVDMGGQSLCTSSAIGRMMLTMMAAFAEFERNLISERTALALAHKRRQRQVYNHVPFGYLHEGNRIVENPEEITIVRTIQNWRAAGHSLQKIATSLNENEVPTKRQGKWFPSTVRQILRNDLNHS